MRDILSCRECGATFSVHPNDQKILDYFDAPAPTLCATHSLQQRLAWRNERHLYKRTCELCKKDMLAMYSPRSYVTVYCRECWYGDGWDAMAYGRDYDPTRPFFDQWFDLMRVVPQFNVWHHGENANCEYTNYISNNRDCYLSFSIAGTEGSLYCKNTDWSRDCTDCLNVVKSELLYDCVSTGESYASVFLTRCFKCTNCYLGRDLSDCQNCFGSVNLKHKQWCWYNEQLTEDEYNSRLANALSNRESFENHKRRFEEFALGFPCECATIRNSEDVSGEGISNSKSIRSSFLIFDGCENIGESYRVAWQRKDVYRSCYCGLAGELNYEISTAPHSSTSMCSVICGDSSLVFYSASVFNSADLFGCVGLQKKQYCILNKQYTKEEYDSLKQRMIQDMKEQGVWGEFFPIALSPFGYNDSLAQEFFPQSDIQARARNWQWEEDQGGAKGAETMQPEAIPTMITDADESLTKQILRCIICAKNYRIVKKELARLKNVRLPVPLECGDCRLEKRMERFIVPILYQRTCMCTEHHLHHSSVSCANEFETTYRPEGKDIVYCKPCYQELQS